MKGVAKVPLNRSVVCKNFKFASISFLLRSIGSLSSPYKIICTKSWLEGEERPRSCNISATLCRRSDVGSTYEWQSGKKCSVFPIP